MTTKQLLLSLIIASCCAPDPSDKIASRGGVRGFCRFGPDPPEASRQRTDVNTDGYLVPEFEQSGRQKTRFKSDTCPAEMLNTGVDLILDCSLASVYNVTLEILISPQRRRLFKCYRHFRHQIDFHFLTVIMTPDSY